MIVVTADPNIASAYSVTKKSLFDLRSSV